MQGGVCVCVCVRWGGRVYDSVKREHYCFRLQILACHVI